MPRKDKTGPEGKGPKTGRGMGDCAPTDEGDGNPKPYGKQMRKRDGSGGGRQNNKRRG